MFLLFIATVRKSYSRNLNGILMFCCVRFLRASSVASKECELILHENGLAHVILNRPEAKNALGRTLVSQLREILAGLRSQPASAVRAVVLSSKIPGVFCAGADLKERATMSPPEVSAFVDSLRALFAEMERLPVPTIACIEGAALGGGLEMALACDMRIVASNASLGLPETSLAIIPGAGGTQRLPRLIGASKAKELMFTARRITGNESFLLGIANHVVSADVADKDKSPVVEKAVEIAVQIAQNGPIAVRAAKQAVDVGLQGDIHSGFEIEKLCYAQVIPTRDRLEGLQAFREKRKPAYVGQ
ncbi:mitochondrial branched-chain amino acid degradation methylglutaconyl-CoA hydratase [Andalucia godoyi]|uniref:Mitochondrial branched-chain amino acid degradation methylglutaconyl-CoA hydratase n=1 Tax=Andalucia godoyi TaxID=505711 RepID=A0A8K0AHX4_ANDGO|nr:mitochondrial branched-chain amino acid degradation methylglutaconyl-CoA hydratase [Andalucia godoyi]|eukprot:ANDGO_03296.mRNA.1 mitochondrial branched-chain amino acid degradation methylglutaconyl-CoA hydratase (enoyl-CoA hydratase/isomerase family domain-containing protein)